MTFLQATTDAATSGRGGTCPAWSRPRITTKPASPTRPRRILHRRHAESCGQPASVESYSDAIYTGELHTYEGCAGVVTAAAVAAVTNVDADIEVVLEFQFPGGLDCDLFDQMLASFAARRLNHSPRLAAPTT